MKLGYTVELCDLAKDTIPDSISLVFYLLTGQLFERKVNICLGHQSMQLILVFHLSSHQHCEIPYPTSRRPLVSLRGCINRNTMTEGSFFRHIRPITFLCVAVCFGVAAASMIC